MRRFLRRLATHPWLTAGGVVILVAGGFGGYWITRGGVAPAPSRRVDW